MLKKKTILFLLVLFSGGGVVNQSAATDLGFLLSGYLYGTCPPLWPFAAEAIIGHIKNRETAQVILGSCGFVTGAAVVGLAVYGLKKLMTKEKEENKDSNKLI